MFNNGWTFMCDGNRIIHQANKCDSSALVYGEEREKIIDKSGQNQHIRFIRLISCLWILGWLETLMSGRRDKHNLTTFWAQTSANASIEPTVASDVSYLGL